MALMSPSVVGWMSSCSITGRGQYSQLPRKSRCSPWIKALDSAPPIQLFFMVCDDVTGSGLQKCNLGGTRYKGFLYTIVHGMDVATVSGGLNALTKIQPIGIVQASSDPLNFKRLFLRYFAQQESRMFRALNRYQLRECTTCICYSFMPFKTGFKNQPLLNKLLRVPP